MNREPDGIPLQCAPIPGRNAYVWAFIRLTAGLLLSLVWIAEVMATQNIIRLLRTEHKTYALPYVTELAESLARRPELSCPIGAAFLFAIVWFTTPRLPIGLIFPALLSILILLALFLTFVTSSAFLPLC